MIKKFKQFNEGINHLLVGPTKDEIWKNLGYSKTFDTPEDFLKELSKKMETSYINSNEVEFYMNGKSIFIYEIKERCLSVDYSIQKLIIDIFGIDIKNIEKLIKNIFIEILGNDNFVVAVYQNEFNLYD